MILDEFVEINVSDKWCKYWREKGYENVKTGNKLTVKVSDLKPQSKIKINCKCEVCGGEKKLKLQVYYKNYNKYNKYTCEKCSDFKIRLTNLDRYDCEYTHQNKDICSKATVSIRKNYSNPEIKNKILSKTKKTNLEIRGVEYSSQDKFTRIKAKETCNLRYGVDNVSHRKETIEKRIETGVKNKTRTSKQDTSEFYQYRLKVDNITNSFKKQLFENWDGYDYYSKEYIKDITDYKDKNYRSIDHKTSILHGFQNNIPAEVIGHIDNLCITTRSNNSSKSSKNFFNSKI